MVRAESREPRAESRSIRSSCARRSPSALRTPHSGFTLLEVIVALSLSILLLTAVYGAIRMQYRISTTGREQMERAQVSRAILRQIEGDIRSVIWQIQEPPTAQADSGSTSSGALEDDSSGLGAAAADPAEPSTGTGSTSPETTGFLSTDDALTNGTGGVYGDTQSLVLHINRPSRSLVYSVSDEQTADARTRSHLVSVNYFIADASSGGVSAAFATQQGGGSGLPGGAIGLARLEVDRGVMEQAAINGQQEALLSQAEVLAPEIVSIEFGYFDGIEWLDSWDSSASGTLPSAIGITLGIDSTITAASQTEAGRQQAALTSQQEAEATTPVMIRYVVALPLAEPYVGEATF